MAIPLPTEAELMAEKLGLIVLCDNCFRRIFAEKIRVFPGNFEYTTRDLWRHEHSGISNCNLRKDFRIDRFAIAVPRKEYYKAKENS